MIKTNTKQAKEAIKNYILGAYDASGYDPDTVEAMAETFEEIARVLLSETKRVNGCDVGKKFGGKWYTWQDAFIDWSKGLPSIFDTSYHCGACAVDLLGDMLEETEEERNRYTEEQAEDMLDRLIFREISKVAGDVLR